MLRVYSVEVASNLKKKSNSHVIRRSDLEARCHESALKIMLVSNGNRFICQKEKSVALKIK